jgi:VWFA-related protein
LAGSAAAVVGVHYLAASPAREASPDVPKQQIFKISDNVNLVLLDVSVKDPKGGYVTGLQKDNFKVFEDGHARDITQFASVDTPVSIGLVVDNSGSMRDKRAEVVMAGLSFAKQSTPRDEFFVVNFNNSVVRGLPSEVLFTDQLQDLRRALFYGSPAGQTALYDAIAYSLGHLEYAHREKRTLIVVSDGGDNVSSSNLRDVMRLVLESPVTIYTVGVFDKDDPDKNPDLLKKLAQISGGEYYETGKIEDIVPTCRRIAKDIRTRYTVGYVPTAGGKKTRHIKVQVSAEGHGRLVARTRSEYLMNEETRGTADRGR